MPAAHIPSLNGNGEFLKEHYLRYGQFEKRPIKFNIRPLNAADKVYSSIATVYSIGSKTNTFCGTGFLYNDSSNNNYIYLITCYHNIKNSNNTNTIRASFETKDNNSQIIQTMSADFRIIGYDLYADVLVGLYDSSLSYNVVNNVDLSNYKRLIIDFTIKVNKGDKVCTIGNLGLENSESLLKGTVIEPLYSGNFDTRVLPIPESILIQFVGAKGFSGSPIFIGDPLDYNDLKIIGMVNSHLINFDQYTLGLSGFILTEIISNIIAIWFSYSVIYANNSVKLDYFIKNGLKKRWLGIYASNYHPLLSIEKNRALSNFPYTGGLLIEQFIIGFNFRLKKFIIDPVELSQQTVIPINTPLLNSKLYNQYIESGRTPIVIKSLTYFDGLRSLYNKNYIGKFSNQVSYSRVMYGLAPVGNFPTDPKYTNPLAYYYPEIIIEYYYYNGHSWILDTDIIGGTDSTFYNQYKDPLGNLYYQHVFEFPTNIIPYIEVYDSGIGNNLMDGTDSGINSDQNVGFIPSQGSGFGVGQSA